MTSFLFIIIVFSPSNPILIYLGLIFFIFTYGVDKIQILKYAKMIKGLGRELMDSSTKIIVFGFVVRLIVGIYQLNNFWLLRNLNNYDITDKKS